MHCVEWPNEMVANWSIIQKFLQISRKESDRIRICGAKFLVLKMKNKKDQENKEKPPSIVPIWNDISSLNQQKLVFHNFHFSLVPFCTLFVTSALHLTWEPVEHLTPQSTFTPKYSQSQVRASFISNESFYSCQWGTGTNWEKATHDSFRFREKLWGPVMSHIMRRSGVIMLGPVWGLYTFKPTATNSRQS